MGYTEMAAEREAEGQTKKLSVVYMPWEKEGQSIIGKFISDSVIQAKDNPGTYKQYVFHTDEGLKQFHCGSFFDNGQGSAMERGGVYGIVFNGKHAIKGGHSVNDFDLTEIAAPGDTKNPRKKSAELDLVLPANDPTD
jgi:hypothetical protein